MKFLFVIIVFAGSFIRLNAQEIFFAKTDMIIDEPVNEGKEKKQLVTLRLKTKKLLPTDSIRISPIEISSASSFPIERLRLETTSLEMLQEDNKVIIEVQTDPFSDKDAFAILSLNYRNRSGETIQYRDTLFIRNSFPVSQPIITIPEEWKDGRSSEVFIGTNFDFTGKITTTDWYGGVRFFLPSITDLQYREKKADKIYRWGISGGIYHSKSFTDFGNYVPDSKTKSYYSIISVKPVPDTNYFGGIRYDSEIRVDSVREHEVREINNWGAYIGVMRKISRAEDISGKHVTNIYVGLHAEVIRRNVLVSYESDTLGKRTVIETGLYYSSRTPPEGSQSIYYDTYFGVSLPIQYLWKDVMDIKLVPCFGVGQSGSDSLNLLHPFYLIQFDLLGRVGGLNLNLGGEIRGYMPGIPAVFSVYVGTSFPITKLIDFVTKK